MERALAVQAHHGLIREFWLPMYGTRIATVVALRASWRYGKRWRGPTF
ncbi:MAG: hypothetical protein KA144_10605 [Xanthomonadaceae bacterium]|nr:hypothetical protein [Xanthomonadaceae bacterium]